MSTLFTELKRRNVFKAALAYIIAGWLIMQVVDVMFPALKLPEWTITFVAALIIIGFPIALIFAWAFEMTPEGIKREKEVHRSESITHKTGRKIDFAIIGLLSLAIVYLVINYVIAPDAGRPGGQEALAKSVAVLPFGNLSNDEANEPFAAGIHEDLLTRLSKIHELKVISRTSVLRYGNTDKTIPEIAAELGVATVMEGGVQRVGDRVRINAQLIDAKSDEHMWAETYDRELTTDNIFAIQSEITEAISTALRATLTPEEEAQVRAVPTENLEAYNAYLLGREFTLRGGWDSLREAEQYFGRAVELDPTFAEAWLGIAWVNIRLNRTGVLRDDELRSKVEPALDRVFELNDQMPEAHALKAGMESALKGDEAVIEEAFEQALALDPRNAEALHRYGIHLRTVDRPLKALPLLEKAAALNPVSPPVLFELAGVNSSLGRFDEAQDIMARIQAIDPANPSGYYGAGQIAVNRGRIDEALLWYRKAAAIDPDPEVMGAIGLYWLDLSDPDRAKRWVDRAKDTDPDATVSNWSRVSLHLYRGEREQAVTLSRRMLESNVQPRWGAESTFLQVLRDEALDTGEYQQILAWYEQYRPRLFTNIDVLSFWKIPDAVDLAYLYRHMGRDQRAQELAEAVVRTERELRDRGFTETWLPGASSAALVVLGDEQAALGALHRSFDSGLRFLWWFIRDNRVFDSIRDHPKFKALFAKVEADMAAQRLNVLEELENEG